jgi:bla regulator protein blaR1
MTRFFLECTIRAALIVGGTAIALYAMRVKVASVKHRVWTAVLLLMLALPCWIAWGPKAPVRILPATIENLAAAVAVQPASTTAVGTGRAASRVPASASAERFFSTSEEIFLGLYLCGTLILLARLAIGTAKARALARLSTPLPAGNESIADPLVDKGSIPPDLSSRIPAAFRRGEGPAVDFLIATTDSLSTQRQPATLRASAACAAPVTVGFLRPTIILPENWRSWSESQLAVVLAHEREHVRRRDPLVQWLALLNRAVFWFHPAAWWLERELSALAEESCDAAVLAQGHDPEIYAETLMHMARAVMDSGARVNVAGAAMPGVRLAQRIRQIVDAAPSARISIARAACVVAISVVVCFGLVAVTLTPAQSRDTPLPSFEAASIKRHQTNGGDEFFSRGCGRDPSRCAPANVSARDLIALAYGMKGAEVLGGPNWVDSERFDVEAKVEESAAEQLQNLPRAKQQAQMALMMRSLLADRFKLAVTHATKVLPVFALVIAKNGPRLTEVPPPDPNASSAPPPTMTSGGPPPLAPGQSFFFMNGGLLTISAKAVRITGLINTLSQQLGRQVLDQTGLTGTYDYSLQFAPLEGFEGAPPPDSDAASIFTALQEQLGLRLVSTTGPVDVLVIDHIEEPTPN